MTDRPIEHDNIDGCPECGYYGSRTWTAYEGNTEFSVTECDKCGYRVSGWVDENGNTRYEDESEE